MLEEVALETGYSLYALNVAFNMYFGNLVQGVVSEGVQAMCGLPPRCGHAVDMLHCLPHPIDRSGVPGV
eukprot:4178082-Amphidinium_carterae.1